MEQVDVRSIVYSVMHFEKLRTETKFYKISLRISFHSWKVPVYSTRIFQKIGKSWKFKFNYFPTINMYIMYQWLRKELREILHTKAVHFLLETVKSVYVELGTGVWIGGVIVNWVIPWIGLQNNNFIRQQELNWMWWPSRRRVIYSIRNNLDVTIVPN